MREILTVIFFIIFFIYTNIVKTKVKIQYVSFVQTKESFCLPLKGHKVVCVWFLRKVEAPPKISNESKDYLFIQKRE